MSGKIGLVLSGGGAKGAYEIGVYKALSEIRADYYIDSIAGTSVGALNAVLMESCGAEYSEQIWRNLKITDMLNPNINTLTKFIPVISSGNKPPQLSMDTMKNNNIFNDSIFDFQEDPFTLDDFLNDPFADFTDPDYFYNNKNPFNKSNRFNINKYIYSNQDSPYNKTQNVTPENTFNLRNLFSNNGLFNLFKNQNIITDFLKVCTPFDQKKIAQLIDRYVDFNRIYRKIFIACTCSTTQKLEYFFLNSYNHYLKKQIVLASSALPFVYDEVEINGKKYADGGIPVIGDNTPVSCLYNNGCRSLIVVHLRYDANITNQYRMRDANIVNIIPSEHLGDLLDGTLNLNATKVAHDIELGYRDTLKHMNEIYSMINNL